MISHQVNVLNMTNFDEFQNDLNSSEERRNYDTVLDRLFDIKNVVIPFLEQRITELHAKCVSAKRLDKQNSGDKWKKFIKSNIREDNTKSKVNYYNADYECITTEPIELAKAYVTFQLPKKEQDMLFKATSADYNSDSFDPSASGTISAPSASCSSDSLANSASMSTNSGALSSSSITDTSLTSVASNDAIMPKSIKIFSDFDIGAVLQIFLNCNAFCNINLDVINKVTDIRNNIMGHPSKRELSAKDKANAINHFKEFAKVFLNVWKEGEKGLKEFLDKLNEEENSTDLPLQDQVPMKFLF